MVFTPDCWQMVRKTAFEIGTPYAHGAVLKAFKLREDSTIRQMNEPINMPLCARMFDTEIALRAAAQMAEQRYGRVKRYRGCRDICLCVADHYEPGRGRAADSIARKRHQDWLRYYPRIAHSHRDCTGNRAVHTFFYPWDEYDPDLLGTLQQMCSGGVGEVELHLHHRDDTAATLSATIDEACSTFRSFGALSSWPNGRPAFAFIHGNWALDNSRVENGRNYCGVDNELQVLLQCGCYADFTFPAWRHVSQPRQTNSIYYAKGRPGSRKAYDSGSPIEMNGRCDSDALMIVQGPLVPTLRWSAKGPRFTMDDGDLADYRRYSPERFDRWVRAGIHVHGRPDRIFIKLHCHGAHDNSRQYLLHSDLDALYTDGLARYNDGERYRLHFVTARELFNVVKATESGSDLDIASAREYVLRAPQLGPTHPNQSRAAAMGCAAAKDD